MSRIYFHSPSNGTVRVSGAERHQAAWLVNRIGLGLLEPDRFDHQGTLAAAVDPPIGYPMRPGRHDLAMSLSSTFEDRSFVLADGKRESPWRVLLNTALRVGSRPMRLLARLHAQCEIHAWVDGPNREWLAGIVEEGRRDGLMRADMGWESVVTLLRARADEPVVTSYSVCEQFPNAGVADWQSDGGDEDHEAWYALPEAERWERAMRGLRADTGSLLELKPEGFDAFHFGIGVSALDLMDRVRKPTPTQGEATTQVAAPP